MTTVDVHQHLWPEQLLRALERRSERPRLRGSRLELTVEPDYEADLAAHDPARRIARMDAQGIDVAILSAAPTCGFYAHPELREAYHEGVLEVVAASGGRLVALSCGERMEGFAGVCVGAPRLVAGCPELLDELEASGGLLFVHPDVPAPAPHGVPWWWYAVCDYTAQMQAAWVTWLAREHERTLPVVFAILAGAGPVQIERMASRGYAPPQLANVYLDTASYGPAALALSPRGQLVYGSDEPIVLAPSSIDLGLARNGAALLAR